MSFITFVMYFWENINKGFGFVSIKYKQVKSLRELVKKDNTLKKVNICKMICGMFYSFVIVICTSYCQKKLEAFCLKSVDKNIFEITLCIRNRLIKFRVIIPRGPSKIIHILSDNAQDSTDEIQPYLNFKTQPLKLSDVTESESLHILLTYFSVTLE